MLVLHANWTDDALHLWAESLDAYLTCTLETEHAPEGEATTEDGDSTIPRHRFAIEGPVLLDELTRSALMPAELCATLEIPPQAMPLHLPGDQNGPLTSDRMRGMVGVETQNGETVLRSEGYTRKASADNGIASVETNGVDDENYQIKEASDGRFYFNLRAGNYQVIGTSEMYGTKYNAQRGAHGVADLLIRMQDHADAE